MLGTEAEDILEGKYLNSKELEDKILENIKEEYNLDEIKDVFDKASVPSSLLFFMEVKMMNLFKCVTFYY